MGASLGGAPIAALPAVPHYWLLPLTAQPGGAAGPAAGPLPAGFAEDPVEDLLDLGTEGALPLSDQERAWCAALAAPLRARYATSRALVRRQLAALLGGDPRELPLHSPPGEPPRLAVGWGHLSLSHSRDRLLLAWSPRPIGVDLEAADRRLDGLTLARRFFPAPELAQLLHLPEARRRRAVLESWVRKEAAIKWRGSSLASELRHWQWDRERGALVQLRDGLSPECLCRERDGWLCAAVGEAVGSGLWA